MFIIIIKCKSANLGRCKRMSEAFFNSCKAHLNNFISSDRIRDSEDPHGDFAAAIVNCHSHYCLDDHSSTWCHHEKVYTNNLLGQDKQIVFFFFQGRGLQEQACLHM